MSPIPKEIASWLAAPVVSRGNVLGVLLFGDPLPGKFSTRDEGFVVAFAAQAATAMDNARLFTAEREARAEAEAANRAKDDFLSMVSHELRTPLQSILGWVAVLRQRPDSRERMTRALDTIERSGRVQAKLIDDLLDASRIVHGRLTLDFQPVELHRVVEAVLEASRPVAAAKGVLLEASLEEEVLVLGDVERLQQVVSNVLGNAIKFTPAGRRVRVTLEHAGDVAHIVVQDEGQGVDPAFLPDVFEPFRQGDDVRGRKQGGLGLGLAIVKSLVERHGGRIDLASEGRDRGATFTIVLPLASCVGRAGEAALRVAPAMGGDDAPEAWRQSPRPPGTT